MDFRDSTMLLICLRCGRNNRNSSSTSGSSNNSRSNIRLFVSCIYLFLSTSVAKLILSAMNPSRWLTKESVTKFVIAVHSVSEFDRRKKNSRTSTTLFQGQFFKGGIRFITRLGCFLIGEVEKAVGLKVEREF